MPTMLISGNHTTPSANCPLLKQHSSFIVLEQEEEENKPEDTEDEDDLPHPLLSSCTGSQLFLTNSPSLLLQPALQ
jgi:hypothetical protein